MKVRANTAAKPVLLVAMSMAVLLLAHCGSQEAKCDGHDDCATGELCVKSTRSCEPMRGGGGAALEGEACESRGDCLEGLLCQDELCANPVDDQCDSNQECARGTYCSDNSMCTTGCRVDGDCAGDERCDFERNRCLHCSLTDSCGTSGGDGDKGGNDKGGNDKGGDDKGGDNGGTKPGECSDRSDCDFGEVCQNSKCRAPTSSTCKSDNQCGRGTICGYDSRCMDGCNDGSDCSDGLVCHDHQCVTCSSTARCPNGLFCANKECVEAPSCGTSEECNAVAPGTVCLGGVCGTCSSSAACNTAPYSSATPPKTTCSPAGLCEAKSCTDEQCRETNTERHYCDQNTGDCKEAQCLNDEECSEGYACDLTTYSCTSCSGAALDSCNATCQAQGKSCDTFTCDSCVGDGAGGGACTSDSDCADGLQCIMDTGIFPLPCDMLGGGGGMMDCTCGAGGGFPF